MVLFIRRYSEAKSCLKIVIKMFFLLKLHYLCIVILKRVIREGSLSRD